MLIEKSKNANAVRLRIGIIVLLLGLWRLIFRGNSGYILLLPGALVAIWGFIGLRKERNKLRQLDAILGKDNSMTTRPGAE